jgi:hypothetical protein
VVPGDHNLVGVLELACNHIVLLELVKAKERKHPHKHAFFGVDTLGSGLKECDAKYAQQKNVLIF